MTTQTNGDTGAQRSLAAAVRQFLNQVGRLLEEQEPRALLDDHGPLLASLVSWRQAVENQTSSHSIEKARALELDKLRLMGEVGALKKESADLRERNEQLRAEVVRLNQREQELKQQILDAEFRGGGARAQAKTLDLEIRDLRRRIRELEGGPPLKPAEAAPRALDKLQALFSGASPASTLPLREVAAAGDERPVADALQASTDNAAPEPRPVLDEDPRSAAPEMAAAEPAVVTTLARRKRAARPTREATPTAIAERPRRTRAVAKKVSEPTRPRKKGTKKAAAAKAPAKKKTAKPRSVAATTPRKKSESHAKSAKKPRRRPAH